MTLPTLDYVLVVILSSLGLFAGIALGKIAKEELKPGKQYLHMFQRLLVIAGIFTAFYVLTRPVLAFFIAILAFFAFPGGLKKFATTGVYILFALLLVFLAGRDSFLVLAVITFLYGLPTGSLLYTQKNWQRIALKGAILFVVIALLLPLIILNI